jgi:[ribosomal protein S5]-alanine N-acetyltransferase
MNDHAKLSLINQKHFLSPFEEKDIPLLVKHLNNISIYNNTCEIPFPYTQKDAEKWLNLNKEQFQKHKFHLNYAIRNNKNEAIGSVGFKGIHLTCGVNKYRDEIGYWLAEPYWRKGIMTDAVAAFCQYGIEKFKLRRIEAVVFSRNISSVKVLVKNKFLHEGTLHKYVCKNDELINAELYALVV